jgi:hypothetical protein
MIQSNSSTNGGIKSVDWIQSLHAQKLLVQFFLAKSSSSWWVEGNA